MPDELSAEGTARWVRCDRCGAAWDASRWPMLVGCRHSSGDAPEVSEYDPGFVSSRNKNLAPDRTDTVDTAPNPPYRIGTPGPGQGDRR